MDFKDSDTLETLIPAKVLTNRDPVILGKLSIREFFQWLFFFALIYLVFNTLLFLDFTYRFIAGAVIFMLGLAFIHSPINGLAGIEWFYVYLRYLAEKSRHDTLPSIAPDEDDEYSASHPLISLQLRAQSLDRQEWSDIHLATAGSIRLRSLSSDELGDHKD
ncbi:MAG TPA: hypothetical protein VH186_09615 [Chloroflexia bacterium]|nr:hypothetical protein [Chloroflexia bacterium]